MWVLRFKFYTFCWIYSQADFFFVFWLHCVLGFYLSYSSLLFCRVNNLIIILTYSSILFIFRVFHFWFIIYYKVYYITISFRLQWLCFSVTNNTVPSPSSYFPLYKDAILLYLCDISTIYSSIISCYNFINFSEYERRKQKSVCICDISYLALLFLILIHSSECTLLSYFISHKAGFPSISFLLSLQVYGFSTCYWLNSTFYTVVFIIP